MIRVDVLGTLEASADGGPVTLPPGKPTTLLARLWIDANRVVPVDELFDALWRETPPASAPKLLQGYVLQLRKALGKDAVETRPPGYRLRLPPRGSDAAAFEALLVAADEATDPASRAKVLERALALWRGPALLEFRNEPFARAAVRRLDELRVAAVEQRIDAELELGRHERAVPELEKLVAEEPLRERPRRQLMLALYRSGRQAEALACYREGRRVLVEELGVEPSRALRELERAILRADPALDDARRGERPRGCVVCVGGAVAPLAVPLAADGRELIVVEVAADPSRLRDVGERLELLRRRLPVDARTAAFTSAAVAEDVARLATDQDAAVIFTPPLEREELTALARAAPCDVAVVPRPDLELRTKGPVVVPFGGSREEWPAVELGAWFARALSLPLRLLGSEAADERRDASRMLAAASLTLQRFAALAPEVAVVPPGAEAILAAAASLVVASLPEHEVGATRTELAKRTSVPLLLVRGGTRPSGIAPARTLTRYTWSRVAER